MYLALVSYSLGSVFVYLLSILYIITSRDIFMSYGRRKNNLKLGKPICWSMLPN